MGAIARKPTPCAANETAASEKPQNAAKTRQNCRYEEPADRAPIWTTATQAYSAEKGEFWNNSPIRAEFRPVALPGRMLWWV